MTTSQTPTGFNLQELYTRIIPGLIATAAVFAPIVLESSGPISQQVESIAGNSLYFLIAVLVSLLFGDLIDTARQAVKKVPDWFRLIIYRETEDFSDLGWRQQRLLGLMRKLGRDPNYTGYIDQIIASFDVGDQNFLDHLRNQINLQPDCTNERTIYVGWLIHMDAKMSSMTRRHRMNYILTENITIALLFSILALFINSFLADFVISVIMIILYGVLIWILVYVSPLYSQIYLQYFLIDYLSNMDDKEESTSILQQILSK